MIPAAKKPIKILFVCNLNMMRSATAENIFKNRPGIAVKSAGISAGAVVRIDKQLVDWADIVFVMENTQKKYIMKKIGPSRPDKKIINLNIPDTYSYMDPDLVAVLKARVDAFLQGQIS